METRSRAGFSRGEGRQSTSSKTLHAVLPGTFLWQAQRLWYGVKINKPSYALMKALKETAQAIEHGRKPSLPSFKCNRTVDCKRQ